MKEPTSLRLHGISHTSAQLGRRTHVELPRCDSSLKVCLRPGQGRSAPLPQLDACRARTADRAQVTGPCTGDRATHAPHSVARSSSTAVASVRTDCVAWKKVALRGAAACQEGSGGTPGAARTPLRQKQGDSARAWRTHPCRSGP